MTNNEYVEILKKLANSPTTYINKFPKNCGYFDGKKWSFDCWNLVKSIINGFNFDMTVGSYVKGFKITGDCDGATILKKCTTKSKDFTKISIPGTYLYMPGHAGSYIGDTLVNGKWVNVVECTGAWTKNVLYSWVDTDGTRRRYKGGAKNGKWTDWGLMCYIDYDENKPSNFIYNGVNYEPVFDPNYYKRYNDVVVVYGSKDEQLFEHFIEWGMKEGRKANETFDPFLYMRASKNKDLRLAYGDNMPLYYEHYCRYGKSEGRDLK